MNNLVPPSILMQAGGGDDAQKPWRGMSFRNARPGAVVPSTVEPTLAETASPPGTTPTGLSKEDRRVLKLILHGQGGMIGPEAVAPPPENEPAAAPSQTPTRVSLAKRYHDGAALLRRLGIGQPISTGSVIMTRSALAVLPSATATTITIVFNGNQPQLALPHDLVTGHDTHLILLRDPSRCFGLAGIPGLGENYEVCLANLRRIIAELNSDKIYCVGISAGGSSALRFGTDLPAQGMLCFSTPTTLNINDDPGAELRHYPQLTILYKRDRSMGIDLGAYYRDHLPRPSVVMIYGANHPRDSWLAERMSGLEGVELMETPGFTGHKTYVWANNEQKIAGLLEKLYTLPQIGPHPQ